MAGNHLEDLIPEWCYYRGYFVRRNVSVSRRSADILALGELEG